jgi:hypothetical protein
MQQQMHQDKLSGLVAWLETHGLMRLPILKALEELGAFEPAHLQDLQDDDIEKLELRLLEKRRFVKALAELQTKRFV